MRLSLAIDAHKLSSPLVSTRPVSDCRMRMKNAHNYLEISRRYLNLYIVKNINVINCNFLWIVKVQLQSFRNTKNKWCNFQPLWKGYTLLIIDTWQFKAYCFKVSWNYFKWNEMCYFLPRVTFSYRFFSPKPKFFNYLLRFATLIPKKNKLEVKKPFFVTKFSYTF